MVEEAKSNGNGTTALAKLLNQLNVPTLLAVMFFGGGNWLKTNEDGHLTREESQRVSREIHELHNAMGDFEKRQKNTLENQNQIMRTQTQILETLREGQRQIMNRQQKLFEQRPSQEP